MSNEIGRRRWAIAEGYIPEWSTGPEPQMESHETLCLLNASDQEANVAIIVMFEDRDPAGPYEVRLPARRTKHVRLNELRQPEQIPRGKDFAVVIDSDLPIVVQHTRLDSRQAANALMTTMGFAGEP